MKRSDRKHKTVRSIITAYFLLLLVVLFLAVYFQDPLLLILEKPEDVKAFIGQFGIWGPVVLMTLQTFQVIIFVVPGQIFTIAGGFLFGITEGTIYSVIGTLFGSIIAFFFSKELGRPFVEKLVSKRSLNKYDIYFKKKGKSGLMISRMIPLLFPIDLISLVAGLTKIGYKDFIIYSTIGLIPNIFLLTYFGHQISQGQTPPILIILTVLGIAALLFIFRELLSTTSEKVEETVKKVSKEIK